MISCRGARRIHPPCCITVHARYKSFTDLKIDSTPLTRGLSAILFWSLLLLKQHISSALLLRFLQHSYWADIVTAARGGQEGESRRRTSRKKGKGKSEERVSRERVPVLHSSKSLLACQWGDSPAAAAAAAAVVVVQSSRKGRCWHRTAIVLDSHITHSTQRNWTPDGLLEQNTKMNEYQIKVRVMMTISWYYYCNFWSIFSLKNIRLCQTFKMLPFWGYSYVL